ncbi:MAG TPA: hypothetical protein VF316_14610 [Polyangiaceae bacterium]
MGWIVVGIFGCAGAVPPRVGGGGGGVARLHASRCGACHTRIEPGQRGRAALETALLGHRKRLRLRERDWQLLVDYLAAR